MLLFGREKVIDEEIEVDDSIQFYPTIIIKQKIGIFTWFSSEPKRVFEKTIQYKKDVFWYYYPSGKEVDFTKWEELDQIVRAKRWQDG